MPSVKFRAAMSESKSICGPLYIDFNSDWFALWFLRIKYVLKGNLLCWVVEFLDLVIFLHKGDFHILCQILGVDHRIQKKLKTHKGKHSERCAAKNDLFVPEKPRLKCIGFSYIGPKLFNMLPKNVKDAKTTDEFKTKLNGCTSIFSMFASRWIYLHHEPKLFHKERTTIWCLA